MKVNEDKLREVLREAIADVTDRSGDRPITVVEKNIKEMAAHMFNISGGEMAYVLNGMTPVDTMTDNFMFKIARVLNEYIKNNPCNFDAERLDVDNYFTDIETKEYKKKIDRTVVDKDIVLDDWIQIADDQWVVKLSNKQIYELSASNRIHYNPETQRNLTIIETELGKIKKVTIDGDAVNAISDDMTNGDYIPNTITLNINPDLYPRPKVINNKFIISSKSIIDCINGFHRTKASTITTKLHREVEFNFIVVISCFDVKKSKKYIIQENYKVPLSEEQVTSDDQNSGANFIINKLKDSLYFKDANLTSITYQLNKMVTSMFNPERTTNTESIQKVLGLFKLIEKNMNNLIEGNDLIGKVFTKEEWFVYLYLINYCDKNNKDFNETTNKIDINSLLEQITITNEPIKQHYKLLSEVTKNV